MEQNARILFLIGTKGQVIKMIPVMQEFKRRGISYNLFSTNQHPKIFDELLKSFNLRQPDLYLSNRDKPLLSIKETFLWLFECLFNLWKLKKHIKKYSLILIHGDTLSTLLGLAAGKIFRVKIAHIESGLRSHSLLHPFPEEIIRRISCKFSDILFAPSGWAYGNLKHEKGERINIKENTIVDLLRLISV